MSDLYSNNTVLLLHMEGVNGSTDFIDSSNVPKSIKPKGNVQISTVQSKFGNGSGYFNGSDALLELPLSLINSEDYTIEAWLYLNAYSSSPSWGLYAVTQYDISVDFSNRFLFGLKENGSKKLYVFRNGDGELLGTSDLPLTTWTHIAVSRSGSTRYLFVNGVLENQGATTGALSSAKTRIGAVLYNNYIGFLNGYLQDVRITKGIARYTNTFTPPSRLTDPEPITVILGAPDQRVDVVDGGALKIIEPVTLLNTPISRRVRLCDQISGRLAREAWSDADTGDVIFEDIREGPWILYALDHTNEYEAVAISDRLATADGARP